MSWVLATFPPDHGDLYFCPQAKVRLGGYYSDPIDLLRCPLSPLLCPLSPLLFAIAIQMLVIAIQDNPDIKGISCGTLYLQITCFCLSIIETKSLALNIDTTARLLTHLREAFSFQWPDKALPYMGVSLTASYSLLYSTNYPPFSITWLNFSCIGRYMTFRGLQKNYAVKMTLLPKLLYLFHSLPIPFNRASNQKLAGFFGALRVLDCLKSPFMRPGLREGWVFQIFGHIISQQNSCNCLAYIALMGTFWSDVYRMASRPVPHYWLSLLAHCEI